MSISSPLRLPRPIPTRPPQRKVDPHGLFMTLCIAAVCVEEQKIVAVSDFMLSNSSNSTEARATKCDRVGNTGRWISLFAGDPSVARLTQTYVRKFLTQYPDEGNLSMMTAFRTAFQTVLKQQIEDALLSPYGMDREQFLQDGRAKFGDEEFQRILYQMNATALNTSFLLAGFDSGGGHVCSIDDPGTSYIHDQIGFHAIGCGAALASAILMGTFHPLLPFHDILYRILEAKFRSEVVPGVGKRTFVNVLSANGQLEKIHPDNLGSLRKLWEKKGNPPVPNSAKGLING